MFLEIYENLCTTRKSNKDVYGRNSGLHKHHIVPEHSGGTDDENNFTYLSVREHIIAHYLLWKLHRNANDLRSMKMLGANLSVQFRREIGKFCADNKIGFHDLTTFDLSERSKKSSTTCKELGIGIFNQEMKSQWASDAGKKSFEVNEVFRFWASPEGRKKRSSMGGKTHLGKKNMYKPGDDKYIKVKPEDIEKFLEQGYVFGEPNPRPKRAFRPNIKKRKPLIIESVRYETLTGCMKALKIPYETLIKRLNSEDFPDWAYDISPEL